MDEPRHVGAPAPAEPRILREAETGTLSPGEGAPSARAPSPREEAAPPSAVADPAGIIEEPGAAAAAEAAVSPGTVSVADFAAEFAAVSPSEVEADGDHGAAPAAVGEGCLAAPAPEPEAAAGPEPRAAAPPHPADPEPLPAEAVAVAGAGPEPVEVVAVAEAAEAAATEPDVRMPEPAEAVAEAEPRRGRTPRHHDPEMHATSGARGLTPFADLGADVPPAQAEPAATQAAPQATEPEALPWGQASDASAASIVRPPEPPARPAWLPAWQPSLPSRETVVAYPRLAGRVAAAVVVGLAGIVLTLVVLYRWVDPPVSTLMLGQRLAGTPIERTWVPLERISPHLIKAVVLSEDGAFCRHRGVDWTALEQARESARGGSTITMQVVKNLFLWPSRSYVRKAIEIALAYLVELIWPKRRILEIYLNVAEWGDGVFGAEAAARWHFGKSAAQLTATEAALLAVALPNPTERMAGSPSPGMSRLAKRLLGRMTASRASLSCVRTAPRLSRQAHLFRGGD